MCSYAYAYAYVYIFAWKQLASWFSRFLPWGMLASLFEVQAWHTSFICLLQIIVGGILHFCV